MTATEIWLVRHGESLANIAASLAESTGAHTIDIAERDADVELSPAGRAQARALGARLAEDPPIDVVWSSPYRRAVATSGIALAAAGCPEAVRVDERLRDRELGVLDLLTRAGVERRHPEEAERRRRLGKYYHRPAGGESWADVALRLRSFLADALPETDGRMLVVSHDAVTTLVVALLLGWSEREILEITSAHTVLNASLTRLRTDADGWTLEGFSDVAHLERSDAPVTAHPGSADVAPQ